MTPHAPEPRPDNSPVHPDAGPDAASAASAGSPLLLRGRHLERWDWPAVVRINHDACRQQRTQHSLNTETQAACAAAWNRTHPLDQTLAEACDFLREIHRQAPFHFLNDDTFGLVGRELAFGLLAHLAPARRRESASVTGLYVTGNLDRENLVEIVEGLGAAARFRPGDRVQTFRGSIRGIVLGVLPDGRVLWRPSGSPAGLTALPETLRRAPR